ncbi:hypothetical protein SAMN06265365_102184 [Tistlia consotensis]|uniref:DUF484 domain-containing protein n=1 Tax=Tistlia consotensis USBA 355 TaxID=560819 RepID=A0A1Y6BL79_9PROT|nr:DUF484 family protein [Tistlia consotensis]SMF08380.1 hypothetical protein SAMN05428998_104132 [Tistlia consotensis USBA 355]SNR35414.1 hypothetical protein SAMN06265365_102184 [Tistlia consotensis]
MTQNRRDPAAEEKPVEPGEPPARQAVDGDQVAGYLRRHPEFLAERPELLDVLDAPARPALAGAGRSVVDLQQAMVERLRRENDELRRSHEELLLTLRSNQSVQSRIQQAALALLRARSFEHLIETVATDLAAMLDLDAVTICVEPSADVPAQVRTRGVLRVPQGTVAALLGPGKTIRLEAELPGDPTLFGPAAGLVQSQALVRLAVSSATPPTLLALGSRQEGHFQPSQGTELLSFLAQVLESQLRAWLDLPE